MPSKRFNNNRVRQRRSRKRAARRTKNKRDVLRKKLKKERVRIREFTQDMNNFIEENTEPIPPDTETIDERTSRANRDPRLRRSRSFGLIQTMGRSSYLGGNRAAMGG